MPNINLSPDSILVRTKDMLEADVDGEVVALSVQKGMCYVFNHVASDVWKQLEHGASIKDICDQLCENFEVDQRQCQDEVTGLVEQLIAEGLVEVRPERR